MHNSAYLIQCARCRRVEVWAYGFRSDKTTPGVRNYDGKLGILLTYGGEVILEIAFG